MTYRVREPFLAVRDDPARQSAFFTVTPGTIIVVKSEPDLSALVEIECEGQILTAFIRDIKDRCEPIGPKAE